MALSPKFDEALAYVSDLHRTQLRKGTTIPYVSHLLCVAGMVLEDGGDEDEAIAALCHDGIEDRPRGGDTRREIEQKFGARVLAIVEACTSQKPDASLSEEDRQTLRRTFKAEYLQRMRDTTDPSVLRVMAADKLHNARAIVADLHQVGPSIWSRFNGTREETLRHFQHAVHALTDAGAPPRILHELHGAVAEMLSLAAA
jgi:(p)ppGpp synthase/HD superfamily hydrolase